MLLQNQNIPRKSYRFSILNGGARDKASINVNAYSFHVQTCSGHAATQLALRELDLVAAVHKLEGVSSAKQIGTLAENLLEGMVQNQLGSSRVCALEFNPRCVKSLGQGYDIVCRPFGNIR